MRRLLVFALLLSTPALSQASGIMIPTEKKLPPMTMLNHLVNVAIEDQAAVTTIEQTFRNQSDRQLEATYILPVPRGASVRKFSMWVDGKEVPGELVEADKARKIYTDIVQRTLDPGLLEYMGNDLLKLRVFPVLPRSDQKVKVSYTSIADSDNGNIEYRYPLKTDGEAVSTLEKFAMTVTLKSQHSLQNIYSPSHAITVRRPNDREATVGFENNEAKLDKDFQLFYTTSNKDVGLTALAHRPSPGQPGYFMLLVAPRAELSKSQQVPRDMVFVLDSSGSMRGKRLTQAKAALKYCLANLNPGDRFNMINFATAINSYEDRLQDVTADGIERARRWVDNVEATGGTAIDGALSRALDMNPSDKTRTYSVVFFTDGRPTIGETNPERILQNVNKKKEGTRIFTFGVGDDVNASMLDQMADQSRAISTYVREAEDIEAKVSSLYSKISNPVLANLKVTIEGGDVRLNEVYPQELPDLFHGGQIVLFGRYTGSGDVAIKLTGSVGKDAKEFVYEAKFADKTGEDKSFVEDLWARRKVGFLLDQIRINGNKKELVDEVVTLAKRYGITTPYTSYLVVPDNVAPMVQNGMFRRGGERPEARFNVPGAGGAGAPAAPTPAQTRADGKTVSVEQAARELQDKPGDSGKNRIDRLAKDLIFADRDLAKLDANAKGEAEKAQFANARKAVDELRSNYDTQRQAAAELQKGAYRNTQEGTLGVNLSVNNAQLRNQSQVSQTASRWLGTRNALDVGGIWIDEAFSAQNKTVPVKAMSNAYFRILERQPTARNVFRIGNHLVWVTPSQAAIVIDPTTGAEEMTDAEIDALFVAVPAKK
ncbi:MAG: VIT domain-containing protein [Planctomycetota bacterium]